MIDAVNSISSLLLSRFIIGDKTLTLPPQVKNRDLTHHLLRTGSLMLFTAETIHWGGRRRFSHLEGALRGTNTII